MRGSTMTVKEGHQRLKEMYGNPKAVFPERNGKVPVGTMVMVFPLENGGDWLDGRVVRGKGKKKFVRVKVRNKTQFLSINNCQFLLEW
jgi:hypothetical protein